MLDIWPVLPLLIQDKACTGGTEDIVSRVAVLEHRDRVCRVLQARSWKLF